MPQTMPSNHRKNLLALAIGIMFWPINSMALDLAEAPPGSVEPYVRPNVIISIDDSGSMNYRLDVENASGASNRTTPDLTGGGWSPNSRRMNVLKYALKGIFDPADPNYDSSLLPDKKIRLAWQAMNANNGTPGDLNTSINSMKILQGAHRTNFLSFITKLTPNSSTPSHKMFQQADAYMRLPLSANGPWANDPGAGVGAPYLGCRRNYHIFMTDGRWNGAVSGGSQDDNTKNIKIPFGDPSGTVFGSTVAASRPNTQLYSDTYSNTLADWAFYSWANPLRSDLAGKPEPATDYRKAPASENFGKDVSNNDAVLDRFWNPRYDPADWPHMVTYTIGFSAMAYTWPGFSSPTNPSPSTPCIKGSSSICAPSTMVPFGYDGSFPDLITGAVKWPQMSNENRRSLDLWHAALNGRGRFYAVEKGEDLEKAFRDIFQQINTATDPDLSASATSGSNVSRSEVGKYTAAYEPEKAWKGFISADRVKTDGTTYPDPNWLGKTTADKIDAISNIDTRLVLSWSDKWESTAFKGGVSFEWASSELYLSTPQKLWLQKNITGLDEGATKGEQRLKYIRGDRTLEGSEAIGYTAAKPYRERISRQGDIINSDVWYTGAPAADHLLKGYTGFVRNNKSRVPMIYVGGNDGMLHGFSAVDGVERIAYIPRGVIPSLSRLTDPQYNNKHKYFVDGSPMTGDVDLNGGLQDPNDPNYGSYTANWRTMLVGTLGLGGKGYFVLDVTNPSSGANPAGLPPNFEKTNAKELVILDRTRGAEPAPDCTTMTGAEATACGQIVIEDKDIGFITSRPVRNDNDAMRTTQITRMNNNRWAVVMGNGYNSINQRPVLLIQYLDGNRELLRIPTTNDAPGTGIATDNGLGAPRLMDLNGDGRADIVYAGDNLGNLWKFDLTSALPSEWNVAFGGNPLYTARGPATLSGSIRGKIQAITTAPTARANDRKMNVGTAASPKIVNVGGMMVAFGTGRNVTKDDPSSVDVQTLYSVLDNTRYREVPGKHLEIHPGGGTCPSGNDCVPAPAALGTDVVAAKLARREFVEDGGFAGIKEIDILDQSTWTNHNGWYIDFPSVGERLLKPMDFYDASNVMAIYSQIPAKGSDVDPNVESCESTSVDTERQYRTFINIMDGKSPSIQVVDKNGDGKYDTVNGDGIFGGGGGSSIPVIRTQVTKGPHTIVRKNKFENADIDAKNNKENLAAMPEESLRPSWRQIQ